MQLLAVIRSQSKVDGLDRQADATAGARNRDLFGIPSNQTPESQTRGATLCHTWETFNRFPI